MCVRRSPPWERTRSTSETKILTPQKVPLQTESSNATPRANLAQSGSKTNGTIQTVPTSCNNNLRSTLSPWSAESMSCADYYISSPVSSASCVSTTGMPTTTTTNSSTTTFSVFSSNATTTTTTSTELLLATHLPASTQTATLKEQQINKRTRNSPIKVSTSTSSSKKIKTTSTLSQRKLPNYWLSGTSCTNKFAALDVDDEEELAQTANSGQIKDSLSQNANKDDKVKNNKPPPIYVQGVECIKTLKSALNEVANNSFTLKILPNNEVRVQAENLQIYKQLHHMLKEKGTKLYTFRPKSERGFKVVLRNMHHSTDQEEIIKELNEKGHKVLNITNIIQRTTKKPLPLFFIELQANDNNKDIYNVNKLMNCIVIFEAPHHKRIISQCTKCQKYGHTKNYCTRDPVCVKCAGKHLSVECKKQIKEVKCALCGGNHTANYKGCEIYKALKIQRFPPLRNKEPTLNTNKNNIPITTAITNIIPGVSYADVASSSREHKTQQELTNKSEKNKDIEELKDMVKSLVNQMTNMMNIITMLLKNMNGQN